LADARLQHGAVEVGFAVGKLCQHRQPLVRHFAKAAEHDDALGAAAAVHGEDARAEGADVRRMAGEHADIALDAGHVDLIDFAREHQLFRRHQFEMQACHRLTQPLPLPVANPRASPITPPIAVMMAMCCVWLEVSGPLPRATSLPLTSMFSGPNLISADSGRVM